MANEVITQVRMTEGGKVYDVHDIRLDSNSSETVIDFAGTFKANEINATDAIITNELESNTITVNDELTAATIKATGTITVGGKEVLTEDDNTILHVQPTITPTGTQYGYTTDQVDEKIANLNSAISILDDNKVDKVSGKGLSTNDYTDAEKELVHGAQKGISYADYQTLISYLNSLAATELKVGQSIYIKTVDVPDLWIYSIESASSTYTYTTDEQVVSDLKTNGYIQCGYYKVGMLETAKVDLSNYYNITQIDAQMSGKASKVNGVEVVNGEVTIPSYSVLPADMCKDGGQYFATTNDFIAYFLANHADLNIKGATYLGSVYIYDSPSYDHGGELILRVFSNASHENMFQLDFYTIDGTKPYHWHRMYQGSGCTCGWTGGHQRQDLMASRDEDGNLYQYIGSTTEDFTFGYFYQCETIQRGELTVSSTSSIFSNFGDAILFKEAYSAAENLGVYNFVMTGTAGEEATGFTLEGTAITIPEGKTVLETLETYGIFAQGEPPFIVYTGDTITVTYYEDQFAWNQIDVQPDTDLSDKADKDIDATAGHIAVFDTEGNPVDGGAALETVQRLKIVLTDTETAGVRTYALSGITFDEMVEAFNAGKELYVQFNTYIFSTAVPNYAQLDAHNSSMFEFGSFTNGAVNDESLLESYSIIILSDNTVSVQKGTYYSIPRCSQTDNGEYILSCKVVDGVNTYSWKTLTSYFEVVS